MTYLCLYKSSAELNFVNCVFWGRMCLLSLISTFFLQLWIFKGSTNVIILISLLLWFFCRLYTSESWKNLETCMKQPQSNWRCFLKRCESCVKSSVILSQIKKKYCHITFLVFRLNWVRLGLIIHVCSKLYIVYMYMYLLDDTFTDKYTSLHKWRSSSFLGFLILWLLLALFNGIMLP